MGLRFSEYVHSRANPPPDNVPEEPTFDPMYGFTEGRKPRVMVATEEQMRAAKLPKEKRDYCAHHFLAFEDCRYREFPFTKNCKGLLHQYEQCQYDDYIIRMKEYERKQRLIERQKKKEQAIAA